MKKPAVANPLIVSLAAGEPDGFAALYDRIGRSLFRVARAMLRSSPDAEDAVQNVFVELARGRHRLFAVRDLDAYVFAVLRHTIFQQARKQRREKLHLQRLAQHEPALPAANRADELSSALQTLPIQQREVIALKIDADLTFAQIAEVLGVSPNTVASRYRYALEKLRKALGE